MVAPTMSSLSLALFAFVASSFRSRSALQAEILALRHQLAVFQNNVPRRLRLHHGDRLLWIVLLRVWSGWRRCLHLVQPDTVPLAPQSFRLALDQKIATPSWKTGNSGKHS